MLGTTDIQMHLNMDNLKKSSNARDENYKFKQLGHTPKIPIIAYLKLK